MNSKAPRTPAGYGRDDGQRPRLDEKVGGELKEIEYDEHSKEKKNYVYWALDDPSKMIRLLQIKGTDTPKIWCKLIEAKFENGRAVDRSTGADLDYEALSWCWGDEEDIKYYILIEDGQEVFQLKTSKNLVMGLWSLRKTDKTRLIWVDAVCIDLNDVEERNQQVRLMAAIYSCATRVCVWLGQGDNHTSRAIPFIEDHVKGLQNFNTLCEAKYMENWDSFFSMMQNPWFSRRWVVQEIALAREAKIYCGSEKVKWRDFSNAVELFVDFENTTHLLSEAMRNGGKNNVARAFNHISALPANLLVQAKKMVFQRYWNEGETQQNSRALPRSTLSLEYLVSFLSLFENSREHDVIYALLAIAKDAQPVAVVDGDKVFSPPAIPESVQDEFPVDYDRPYVDVCKDFIEFCIRHSDPVRALDIICRPWAQSKKNKETAVSKLGKVQRPQKRRRAEPQADPQGPEASGNEETLADASLDAQQGGESLQNSQNFHKFFPLGKANNNEHPSGRTEFIRARTEDMPLPSWVTPLAEAPFASAWDARLGVNRRNADPLVGIPGDGQRRYNASQTTAIHMEYLRFRKRVFQEQNHYSMYVKGFQVDQVDKVEGFSQKGAIAKEWVELAGCDISESSKEPLEHVPEDFWRTIIANRGHDGQPPREYYGPACLEALNSGGISGGAIITSQIIEDMPQNYKVVQFCRRVLEVIWNRRLIKTKKGHLGLARRGVSKGDLVCIFFGCSVPVILHENKKSEKQVKDEEEEDESATIECALLHFLKKRGLKRKRETQRKAFDKLPDHGQDSPQDIKKVKSWGKREIRAYVRAWNEIGKQLEEARGDLTEAEKRVNEFEKNQRSIYKEPSVQPTQENLDKEHWYKFNGECYIHGMMDGEAMKLYDNGRIANRVFELR